MKISRPIIFGVAVLLLLSCKNDYTSDVKAEQKTEPVVSVTNISLMPDEDTISLVNGTPWQINAHVQPENATDKKLTFSLDNQEIASITADGKIMAKAVGHAVITIKAADGISKTVNLTVIAAPVPVTSIVFDPALPTEPIELVIGKTYQFHAKVMPEDATNKKLNFTTSDSSIAWLQGEGNSEVKADGLGEATVTITSADNPSVKKEVHFKIKPKPSIKIKTPPSVCESNGGVSTFTIETLNGKLEYTPVVVGDGSKWLSFSHKAHTSENIDTVHLTVNANKTVWYRNAYIKFKGDDNEYIKEPNTNKDMQVKLVQKRNDNPIIHYKWVDGIGSPTDAQKEKMKIKNNGIETEDYFTDSFVFKWKETADTKFYNARKLKVLYKQDTIFPNNYFKLPNLLPSNNIDYTDLNQCWAKTASNMLHWWFEQNKGLIADYMIKSNIAPEKRDLYNHNYARALSDAQEGQKSDIANIFRRYTHDQPQGGYIENAITWYLYRISSLKSLGSIYPALFNDVFTPDTSPSRTERGALMSQIRFEQAMNKALDGKQAIGFLWKGEKAGKNYAHAVTCWGAAYDEENNIVCVYIAESNLAEPVLYPFGVRYEDNPEDNRPYMYNYVLSKPEAIYIDELVTLDRGVKQFQNWLAAHP